LAKRGYAAVTDGVSCPQFLCELVIGAARHGCPHKRIGVVRIEVARQDPGWCCTVTDRGGGSQHAVPAAGLGTQIVEALIRRLNGRVIVQSTDEGTTVALLIPLASAALLPET
jgi:two-component sensor histidine kinase